MKKIVFYLALMVVLIIPIEGYAIVDGLSYNGIFTPMMILCALLSPKTLFIPKKKYIKFVVVFVLLCYFSIYWSGFPGETFYRSYLMTQHLIFILILNNTIRDKYMFKKVLIFYLIGAVICASGMIFEVINYGVQDENSKAGVFRSSMFGNSNENAFLITYAIIFVFILINKYNIRKLNSFFLWCVVMFLAISIVFSGSRNGFIMLIITLLSIGLFYMKQLKLSAIVFVSVLFMGFVYLALMYIPQGYINRILDIGTAIETQHLSNREIIWANAIGMMYEPDFSFLTGKGWGTFVDNYYLYTGIEYGAHNFYLNTLFTLGIVGLVILFIYLYDLFGKIRFFYKQSVVYVLLLFIPLMSMLTTNWDTRKWWFFMGVIIYKFAEYFREDNDKVIENRVS